MKNIVHIVFGDSAEGNLKFSINKYNVEYRGSIINFSDDMSIGPIMNLDEEEGLEARIEYYKNIFSKLNEKEVVSLLDEEFKSMYSALKNISKDSDVIIWYGNNVIDRTALLYLVTNLKESNLYCINVSEYTLKWFDGSEYTPKSLGECEPKDLGNMLENIKKIEPTEKESLSKEWKELSLKSGTLRVLEDNNVIFVNEDYYDDALIRNSSTKFNDASEVIGNTLGEDNNFVGDVYLEFRLRTLIEEGKLDMKGKLKNLKDYKVKKI